MFIRILDAIINANEVDCMQLQNGIELVVTFKSKTQTVTKFATYEDARFAFASLTEALQPVLNLSYDKPQDKSANNNVAKTDDTTDTTEV